MESREEKAVIYWMDETGVQNCSNQVRGYAPKGHTLVLVTETKGMHINMVSAITNTGRVHFRIYREAMNADLILNVHHSGPVKAWLEEQKDRISMFHLPLISRFVEIVPFFSCDSEILFIMLCMNWALLERL